MALKIVLLVFVSVVFSSSHGEMALANVTRLATGDLFSLIGSDCGPTRCMEVSHGTALAALGDGCVCRCRRETPTFREDQRVCVNHIDECQMASYGRGAKKPQIPFVFLPQTGQIIYPSKEIIFTDVENAVCAVTSAQYLSTSGWVTLRDFVDNDVPFGLYRDEGSTYLQWRGSPALHDRLEGRLVAVHVLCSGAANTHLAASCAAFRVAGASHNALLDVRSIPFHAGEIVSTLEPNPNPGLSVLESLAIGVCVLLLIFVYAAGIIFYIHYKQRQKRKEKDPENDGGSENGSSMEPRLDMSNVTMKTNPLLKLGGMGTDFMSDTGLSDSDRNDNNIDSPTNTQSLHNHNNNKKMNSSVISAMVHSRKKKPSKPSRPSIRQSSSANLLSERLYRRSTSPDTFERIPHSDLSIVDCTVEHHISSHRQLPSSDGEPLIRKKLYFNPLFFETEHLKNPPPAAIEFLIKIREIMSIAKEKMSAKRFYPLLSDIPEEDFYHAVDLGWDIPCARRGRRFSAISLKQENSRKAINCEGCPGCDSVRPPKVALTRSNSCKSCVSEDYKQKIVRKWLDEVPTPAPKPKPKASDSPKIVDAKPKERFRSKSAELVKKDEPKPLKVVATIPKKSTPEKPKEVVQTPKELILNPSEITAKLREMNFNPQDVEAKPKEITPKVREFPPEPKHLPIKPSELTAKLKDIAAKSSEAALKPREITIKPKEPVKPKETTIKLKETTVTPKELALKSKDIAIKTKDFALKTIENALKPKENVDKPSQDAVANKTPSKFDAIKTLDFKKTRPVITVIQNVPSPENKSPSSHASRRIRKKLPPPPPPPPMKPPAVPEKPESKTEETSKVKETPMLKEAKVKMGAVIKELNGCKKAEPIEIEEMKLETITPMVVAAPKIVIPVIAADSHYFSDDNLLMSPKRKDVYVPRDNTMDFDSLERTLMRRRRFSVACAPELTHRSDISYGHVPSIETQQRSNSWLDMKKVAQSPVPKPRFSQLEHNHSSNEVVICPPEPLYDNLSPPGPLTIQVRGSPVENRRRLFEDFDPDTLDRKPKHDAKKRVEKILLRSAGSFKYKSTSSEGEMHEMPSRKAPEFHIKNRIGNLRQIYESKAKAQDEEKMMYKRRGSLQFVDQDLADFVRGLKTPDLIRHIDGQKEPKPPVAPKVRRSTEMMHKFAALQRDSPQGERRRMFEDRERSSVYSRAENLNARKSGRRSARTRSRRTDIRKLYRTEDSGYMSTDSNESKRRAKYYLQLKPKNTMPEPHHIHNMCTRTVNKPPIVIESDTDDMESICDGRSESGGESVETDSVFFGNFDETKEMFADLEFSHFRANMMQGCEQIDSGFIGETNIILSGDSDSEHRSVISIMTGRSSAASMNKRKDGPYMNTIEC